MSGSTSSAFTTVFLSQRTALVSLVKIRDVVLLVSILNKIVTILFSQHSNQNAIKQNQMLWI